MDRKIIQESKVLKKVMPAQAAEVKNPSVPVRAVTQNPGRRIMDIEAALSPFWAWRITSH